MSAAPRRPGGLSLYFRGRSDIISIIMSEFDLKAYLCTRKALVEGRLEELVPEKGGYASVLHEAMRYSLLGGGKRLRPILAMASAEAVGASPEAALDAACALECIHTYSLIHDDLPALDNDDLRRGRPTCHRKYGEAMAILAGDALLTLAFEIIASAETGPERALRVVDEVARGAGASGMIGGQVVDLMAEGREITFPELEYMHTHKTGRLMRASVRSGAILGGATEEELEALTEYGACVGLAFQILDDILDVEGVAEEMGKPVGGDARKGKNTYPAMVGLAGSREQAGALVRRAVEAIAGLGPGARPLRAIAGYIVSRRN